MSFGALLAASFAAGIVGNLHCAAMCGPIAAAGCKANKSDAIGYFAGRAVGYTTLGAVLGHLGRHALCVLPMRAFEIGAALLVAAFAGYKGWRALKAPRPQTDLVPLRRSGKPTWTSLLTSFFPKRGMGLGVATAILPCGLLLPAWALAASTASPLYGAAAMLVFSLATLPGLAVVVLGRGLTTKLGRAVPPWAEGLGWCALALWVAARPLLVVSGACHLPP